ncbi:TPA: hypothetical protein DCX15_01660 [bacterium]|nr:hypothetical protein [bacterium]
MAKGEWGIDRIDKEFSDLEASLTNISPFRQDSLDAQIRIEVDREGFAAYLVISPPQAGGRMVELKDVARAIKDVGILNVDWPAIKQALSERRFSVPVLIAKGTPPGRGRKATLVLEVKNNEFVKEGQLLATKFKPTPGAPGLSVRGERIPGLLGEDLTIAMEKNLRLSEDDTRIYAAINGVVTWDGKRLYVNEASLDEIVHSDLDLFLDKMKEAVRDPEFDAQVKIIVERDKAYVVITPPRAGGKMPAKGDILRAIESKGIYPEKERVDAILTKKEFNTPLLISQAIPPIKGKDGRIIYQVETKASVKEGQLLAVREKATPGRPGRRLNGELVPAEPGQDVKFVIGQNVRSSADGLKAYAAIDGEVIIERERISVRELQIPERPEILSDREFYQIEKDLSSFLEETRESGHDPSLDARIEVNIEKDLFAYGTIVPPKIGGRMLPWDELKKSLLRNRISRLDEAAIYQAFKERRFNAPILIAQGRPPVNGQDARIIFRARRGDEVKKGDVIAIKELPTKGIPGVSVWGEEVPAEEGKDLVFNLGENVSLGDNGLAVYARVDGILCLDDDRIGVLAEEVAIEPEDFRAIAEMEEVKTEIAYDSSLDGGVEVRIDEDLEAYLILIPPKPGGRMMGMTDLKEALSKEGILELDKAMLTELLSEKRFNTPILIAQGRPPVNGRDSQIIFKVKGGERVKKGDLLAVKELPIPGIPGLSVKGKKIPARDGRDTSQFYYGENIEVSEDGLSLYAAVDGRVYWNGPRIAVEEIGGSVFMEDLETADDEIESLFESIEEIAAGKSNVDGEVEIELRADGAEAYLTIVPPKIGGKMVTFKEIYQKVEEVKIRDVDHNAINAALLKRYFNRPILIAKGAVPTQGKDASYFYRFGIKDGINLKEEVVPGQLLMVKKPATKGLVGRSVTGEEIPAKLGRDLRVMAKRGVVFSKDGIKAYATTYGQVIWEGNALSVEKIKEIDINVDEIVGGIDFDGRIFIAGSVDAVSIRATSDIQITGNVSDADINSKGSVCIEGSVSKAKVVCKGDVIARAMKESEIEADGGVIVSEEIVDCQIKALGWVVLQDKKGQISGGRISAQGGIDAGILGAEDRKKTIFHVNEDAEIRASRVIYPGVELKIGEHNLEIKKPKEKISLSIIEKKIGEKEYQPTQIERTVLFTEADSGIRIEEMVTSVVITDLPIDQAKRMGAEFLELREEEVEIEKEKGQAFRIFKVGTVPPTLEGREGESEPRRPLEDEDGSYRIVSLQEGLFLTVFPAIGEGKPVQEETVLAEIAEKNYRGIEFEEVKKAVELALAIPVKIGSRQYRPEVDGTVLIEIIDNGRGATLTLIPAKKGGLPITFGQAMEELKAKGVVAGIKEDLLRQAIEEERFSTPILIAEEISMQKPEEVGIEYKFRIEQKLNLVEDEMGRIDFRELGLIQNVRAGQVLARKRMGTSTGRPGKRITGETIHIPPPVDLRFPAGKNTVVSEDGLELLAAIDGLVVFSNERVNVEPLYEVKGDVDLSTGSIDFFGSVDITGNVLDGFRVIAEGDIQIRGGVGKSFIRAQGSVVVGAGIQGGREAEIRTGKDLICKFIENAKVESKGSVIVTQEIMHSFVDADERIEITTGRGLVVGGQLRAGKEIVVKSIGSRVGTSTVVEVGVRPRLRQQLLNLERMFEKGHQHLKKLKVDIAGLRKLRQGKGLSEDKEELLMRFINEENELAMKLRSYAERRAYLEGERLKSSPGKVVVLETVCPGVVISVRTAEFIVKEPMSNVTFTFEDNQVKVHAGVR